MMVRVRVLVRVMPYLHMTVRVRVLVRQVPYQ
jgi:hypothetical protein